MIPGDASKMDWMNRAHIFALIFHSNSSNGFAAPIARTIRRLHQRHSLECVLYRSSGWVIHIFAPPHPAGHGPDEGVRKPPPSGGNSPPAGREPLGEDEISHLVGFPF